MFGRGAISVIYGWALQQAGHDIEFYVRRGRAETYGSTIDLDLLDTRPRVWGQRIRQSWTVRYREVLGPDDDFDLIVLSVPHYRLSEAVDFLAPRIGKAMVLMFGNVWSEPLDAIGALSPDQVAWGFPGASGGFNQNGVLYGALLRSVVVGAIGKEPSEREYIVRQTFRGAGFRLQEQADFRGWLWIHFVMNAGMLSQGLKVGSLANMAGATGNLREALLTIRELLPLVEARGIDLRRHRSQAAMYGAPTWLTARALAWATAHFPPARRSFQAHYDPEAQEPRVIYRDTLAEARRLGIAVPRLEMTLLGLM